MNRDPFYLSDHLLDHQIVDRDGCLVGKVDDIELVADSDDGPVVVALLCGQQVLGARIGGVIGRWMSRMADRLRGPGEPELRIPIELVDDVTSAVTLSVSADELVTPGLEKWLRSNVIDHIPGAHHESE